MVLIYFVPSSCSLTKVEISFFLLKADIIICWGTNLPFHAFEEFFPLNSASQSKNMSIQQHVRSSEVTPIFKTNTTYCILFYITIKITLAFTSLTFRLLESFILIKFLPYNTKNYTYKTTNNCQTTCILFSAHLTHWPYYTWISSPSPFCSLSLSFFLFLGLCSITTC